MYTNEGGSRSNWKVIGLENLFSVFAPKKEYEEFKPTSYLGINSIPASGQAGLIIENKNHILTENVNSLEQYQETIKAYKDLYKQMKNSDNSDYIKYISIFKNKGEKANASQIHPHSQIFALPVVPPMIDKRIQIAKDYYLKNNENLFDAAIKQEKIDKKNIVFENNDYILITPYASKTPYEMRIIPKFQSSKFEDITQNQSDNLAEILRESVKRLEIVKTNDLSYNYVFNFAPVNSDDSKEIDKYYRWTVDLIPREKPIGGFDWLSGIYAINKEPSDCAEELRNAG